MSKVQRARQFRDVSDKHPKKPPSLSAYTES